MTQPTKEEKAVAKRCAEIADTVPTFNKLSWGERKRFDLRDLQSAFRDGAQLAADTIRADFGLPTEHFSTEDKK